MLPHDPGRDLRRETGMLTVIFIVVFGVIVVGFGVWGVGFGGMKRRGQSGTAELNKAPKRRGGLRAELRGPGTESSAALPEGGLPTNVCWIDGDCEQALGTLFQVGPVSVWS